MNETVVDVETGEVVEILSLDEAKRLTDAIRSKVEDVWVAVVAAYEGRAWIALGYGSWDAYCDVEFREARVRLPREERRDVVASLREAGLSLREIAAVTGNGYGTVQADDRVRSPEPDDGQVSEEVAAQVEEARRLAGKGHTTDEIAAALGVPRGGMRHFLDRHGIELRSRNSPAARRERIERIRKMAAAGATSRQIAEDVGLGRRAVTDIAKAEGIEIHADRVLGRAHAIDPIRVVSTVVDTVATAVSTFRSVGPDISSIDPEVVGDWLGSLDDSIRELRRLRRHLDERNER